MNCNYDRVVYRMKVRQRISSECSSKMELVELTLKDVKGVRMNVTGFGLLNWIAGKTVSNLIQETVLQVTLTRLRSRSSIDHFPYEPFQHASSNFRTRVSGRDFEVSLVAHSRRRIP